MSYRAARWADQTATSSRDSSDEKRDLCSPMLAGDLLVAADRARRLSSRRPRGVTSLLRRRRLHGTLGLAAHSTINTLAEAPTAGDVPGRARRICW